MTNRRNRRFRFDFRQTLLSNCQWKAAGEAELNLEKIKILFCSIPFAYLPLRTPFPQAEDHVVETGSFCKMT